MLEVESICAGYGDLSVLDHVSLHVGEGEFVGVVGANAAGKTTLARALTGLIPLRSGEVRWNGQRLDKVPAHQRPDHGLVLVPEGRALFGFMTVRENLEIGATNHSARARLGTNLDRVYGLFPVLKERDRMLARSLSGGQQQMLAIARALMAQPQLLILDEPSVGLAPKIVSELYQLLGSIFHGGMAILLIEQDVRRCLGAVQRAHVMASGRVVMVGAAKDLLASDEVRKAYLGL